MKRWIVPFADLDFDRLETAAVARVLRSRWLTMGAVTKKFETAFARYLGVRFAYAVASGTAALDIANRVIGLKSGDEVICPTLSFVATANTIVHCGAVPRFADSTSLDDWTISSDDIERRITRVTRALVVMHYGTLRLNNIIAGGSYATSICGLKPGSPGLLVVRRKRHRAYSVRGILRPR